MISLMMTLFKYYQFFIKNFGAFI